MKKFSLFSTLFIIVSLCACVSSGYFLSSVIISSGLFQTTSHVSSEKETFFAISFKHSNNETDLQNFVKSLHSANGAGYIFDREEGCHLIASIYDNENDAQLVKNNLNLNNYDCEILKIETPQKAIEGAFAVEEKEILQKCLKIKTEIFKALYDVAISLDTNIVDKAKAKLECNNIYSNFIATKTNFETFFDENNLSYDLLNLKTELDDINQRLSNLIGEKYVSVSQTFSSLIKLCYCQILLNNI